MKCLECQELLQQRLDGEPVTDAAALEQHLNECAACREQHLAALRLLDGLKALPKPQPPPGFAQTLAAEVLRDRRQRRAKVQRGVYVTVGLAASVMLMLILAYYWLPRSGPIEAPKDLAKQAPQKQESPPKDPAPPAQKPEADHPFAGIPDRWADTTRDHAKVLLVAANLDGVENLPAVDSLPDIETGVREASQEVSDGVRTVTRNARRAFDFFARELPMPDMGDKN
jgi:hypothetical protein